MSRKPTASEMIKANGKGRVINARTARGYMPGMNPTRKVSAPVVTRMATAEDIARFTTR